VECERGLQPSCGLAVDQKCIGGRAGAGALGRLALAPQPFDANAEPVDAGGDLAVGRPKSSLKSRALYPASPAGLTK
jgi:hypothetical protein